MVFWILAALVTVAVAVALLVPLARRNAGGEAELDYDIEVYSDQLREIDRDVENNLISGEEAEYARAEVGRRLIKASKQAEHKVRSSQQQHRAGRLAVILVLPVFAVAGYIAIGNPGMPAQPLAARLDTAPQPVDGRDIEALIAEAETHLASNPDDGRGWDVLAPIYMRLGRLGQAETAYRNAIRLLGSAVTRQAGLGQVLFAQSVGIVTADAQRAFQSVLDAEPDNPFAAYFLALALAQEGRSDEVLASFRAIAAASPPDAPWMLLVREQIRWLAGADALPGPDAEDVEAAMAMAPEERREMIVGMVAGLDAKLQENPEDLNGWLRLIQSYMVLGETEQAGRALQQAMGVFSEGSTQRTALTELAASLGLEMTGAKE